MDLTRYYAKLENLHYKNFLTAFLETTYYNRLKSMNDTNIQRLLNSFMSENDIEEENINKSIFGQKFSILFFVENATDEEKEEIQDILDVTNLDVIFNIPDDNYLNSHHYDPEYDYIIPNVQPLSPYPSWSYDIHTSRYWPPIPKPELTEENILNNNDYKWDENSLSWILVNT